MNRIVKQNPQWDNGAIYNKEVIFKLENYDLLKMLFLEFTLVPSVSTTFAVPSSPYLIENVLLESQGMPIARVNTNYTLSRIDRAVSNVREQMTKACSINGTFNVSKTITLPLFFWTIDGQELDLSIYKDLTIRVFTKGSFAEMGFNNTLSSLDIQLIQSCSQRQLYGYDSKQTEVPLDLSKSYNFYQAENYTLASGSTSTRVNLNVPYKSKSIMFMIRLDSNSATKGCISSVVINRNNGIRNEYTATNNYFIGKTDGENENNVFTVYFDESYDTGLLTNANHSPAVAEITYTVSGASTLFVGFEYSSDIIEQEPLFEGQGTRLLEQVPRKF